MTKKLSFGEFLMTQPVKGHPSNMPFHSPIMEREYSIHYYTTMLEKYENYLRGKKEALPTDWYALPEVSGHYLNTDSNTVLIESGQMADMNRNVFRTLRQARSARAKAMLSQLMHVYNGMSSTWADWSSRDQRKFVIRRFGNEVKADWTYGTYAFLAFQESELRDEFLKNFESLIRVYFELTPEE